MKKCSIGKVIYWILAVLFSAVFIYPVYFTVISSFKNNNEIWNTMFAMPSAVEWGNYISAVFDVQIIRAVANSFLFSIGDWFKSGYRYRDGGSITQAGSR